MEKKDSSMVKRREMIRNSCKLCLSAIAFGMIESIQSCITTNVFKTIVLNNRILIPMSLFEGKKIVVANVKEEEFNIAVLKIANNQFNSFRLQCTHANNPLIYTGDNFKCNLHGSEFSEQGKVIKGPAEIPLPVFLTVIEKDNIVVYLSG